MHNLSNTLPSQFMNVYGSTLIQKLHKIKRRAAAFASTKLHVERYPVKCVNIFIRLSAEDTFVRALIIEYILRFLEATP